MILRVSNKSVNCDCLPVWKAPKVKELKVVVPPTTILKRHEEELCVLRSPFGCEPYAPLLVLI